MYLPLLMICLQAHPILDQNEQTLKASFGSLRKIDHYKSLAVLQIYVGMCSVGI